MFRQQLNSTIDIILTSFKVDVSKEMYKPYSKFNNLDYYMGSFIGVGSIPIYILAITFTQYNKVRVCVRTNAEELNVDKMIQSESNIEKIYEL